MDKDWRIPAWAVEGGLANVQARRRSRGIDGRLGSSSHADRPVELLPEEPVEP
jgi:hypothetical protein